MHDTISAPRLTPATSIDPDRTGFVRGLSTAGFHKVAYTDWGPLDAAATVVCLHGLTRQGRDFDHLASTLAKSGYRVICPDLPGRGRSDWLPNVFNYVFPQYCADMATLLATLGAGPIYVVGTSLGGLIGMVLAGMKGSPIAKLVVNDIGPEVPASAVARVGFRVTTDPNSFASFEEAEHFNRQRFAACGPLTDEQWHHFTKYGIRPDGQGRQVSLLDPKVVIAYGYLWYYQMTLWNYWDQIKIPLLAIRGAESDFVPPRLIQEMKRRAPQMSTYDVPDTGHMPTLMNAHEIDVIESFLASS